MPRAFGAPLITGMIRRDPEDFVVEEALPFQPTGEGEHLYLRIRKTGQNTRWVAKQIARKLDLPFRAIGFAGMKDRHAVTAQWFSVHLPGMPDPEPARLEIEGVEIVDSIRHTAKLRIGAISNNAFRIVIRDIVGDRDALEERLEVLRTRPVPNYFGAQRFGRGSGNLDLLLGAAAAATPGRDARSFGLSALRSALFNLWLARRIDADTWQKPLPGEIAYRPHDKRFVHVSKLSAAEQVLPTGLLWGVGDNQATDDALAMEQAFFEPFGAVRDILCEFEARMMRRPLGADVTAVDFVLQDETLELEFSLGRGQFATSVIRELGNFSEPT